MSRQPDTLIHDFTSGSVTRALLRFTTPIFLANLLQAVYNMVDMVVVGKVVGETGLSGISIGGELLTFLTFLAMGFSNAGQVIISQYIGADRRDRLSRFVGTMFTSLLLCAVLLTALCLLLHGRILGWMNTPAEAWAQAGAYSSVCIAGLPFIYGYNAVSAVLRGLGDSKRPFLFVAIASVLNLLLDLLFVIVFGWEAGGAALATVIAQAASFIISLVYLFIRRDSLGFELSKRSLSIEPLELLTLVRLGIPMAIRSASVTFSKLFVNSWVNSFGVTVSAVFGIGSKLDTICNLFAASISASGSSIVGQNIGAGKYERVTRLIGAAFLLSGSIVAVLIAVLLIFPNAVFGLFTGDPKVLAVCMEYIPAAVISFAACAARAPMNAFTNGCGNYKFNFGVAIMDGIVGRIGCSLLFGVALGLGYRGFWLGNALASFVPFLLGGVYYISGWWRKNSSLIRV